MMHILVTSECLEAIDLWWCTALYGQGVRGKGVKTQSSQSRELLLLATHESLGHASYLVILIHFKKMAVVANIKHQGGINSWPLLRLTRIPTFPAV